VGYREALLISYFGTSRFEGIRFLKMVRNAITTVDCRVGGCLYKSHCLKLSTLSDPLNSSLPLFLSE
jgi:hypothetical protein